MAGPPFCSRFPVGHLWQQRWLPRGGVLPNVRPWGSAAAVQHHSPVTARYPAAFNVSFVHFTSF